MRDQLPKIVVVALLLVIIGVPFLLRAAESEGGVAGGAGDRLVLYTPHNEQIRYELSRGFNKWRASQGKPEIDFDWRSGGTSDLRRQTLNQFEAKARRGAEDEGIGIDLFFGGGPIEHDAFATGVKVTRNGEEVAISVAEAPTLSDELMESAFPEPLIGSERLYHADRKWIGVALASFGIVYNRDLLQMLGLEEPQTWSYLADPRYAGWVALGDPAHSGSIGATYDAILRRMGWPEGWALLRRVFANSRYFTAGASKVPVDVSAGEAAAGMCIDFYGRFQAEAVGGTRVGYVDPPQMTAITADPITMLRGAPNRAVAEEFVGWLLSPQAQRLWQRKVGTEGGPERFELRRQPIRQDLYTLEEKANWTDSEIAPFATAAPYSPAGPSFYRMVAPVTHAMAIDIHADLAAAWRAIQRTSDTHANLPEMLRLFDAMPAELRIAWADRELEGAWQHVIEDDRHPRHAEAVATLKAFQASTRELAGNHDLLLEKRVEWTHFFRENYRQIVALSEAE